MKSFKLDNITWLDGLRGVAVIIVLGSHFGHARMNIFPNINLIGFGQFGIYIFFFLSWFLLSRQFYKREEKITIRYLISYFNKRIFRVIPLYYIVLMIDFYITKVYFPDQNINMLFSCMLLKEAPGVFRTIPIEIKSYLLLPVVSVIFKKLSKNKEGCIILIITVISMVFLNIYFGDTNILGTLGIEKYYIYFIAGSITALIHEKIRTYKFNNNLITKSVLAICITMLVIQIPIIWIKIFPGYASVYEINWEEFYQYRYLIGVFIIPIIVLITLLDEKSFLKKVLDSKILRYIGKISFSIYCIHMLVINVVFYTFLDFSSSIKSIITLIITLIFSTITYYLIETTFIKIGHKLNSKIYNK
ncbi:acyltransferase family protein [Clostridioides sp. ZZV14-6345]|uniref:acyltransferase family protein n=1 Tax=Clostridioides sp. ZZV14-6345 TaxID=2811496 RepID=UPI001D130177|nr:acyltransferase [Clostridioides sp. ZZV14-6345]